MNFDDTARIWGPSEKLWPALFVAPSKAATRLCLDCRKVVVEGTKRYCSKCAAARHRAAKRKSARKRRLNVDKTENSPIRAETLTPADKRPRYSDSKTSVSGSVLSTRVKQWRASALEARESLTVKGGSAS